jgi:uncharacterized protein with PIN domain
MIVTAEGQIKQGDTLRIVGKNTLYDQEVTAKEIITTCGNEEVIINKKKNRYFITKLLLNGNSWAKQVVIHRKACNE